MSTENQNNNTPAKTGNPGAVAQKEKKSLKDLISDEAVKAKFAEVLGKNSAAFISSIIALSNSNTDLSQAEPGSILGSAMMAATLNLPINQNLAFAHIVPFNAKQKDGTYKKMAQFQLGWRGYVQLAMRTGQYKTINAAIVYEGQLVEQNSFTGEFVFDDKAKKSNTVVGYVAYFKLLNGFEKYWYMTKEQISEHGKKYSKSYANEFGRWKNDFDGMALKTVIKQLLSKFGILSVEMQRAVETDQAVLHGVNSEIEYADRADSYDVAYTEIKENANSGEVIDISQTQNQQSVEAPKPEPVKEQPKEAEKPAKSDKNKKEQLPEMKF